MSWASIIIALLKLANLAMDYVREKQLLDAGADREIAHNAASILSKTKAKDEIWKEVGGFGNTEADKAMKDLEPK